VSLYLKKQSSKVAAVCPDPYGAAMWSWFMNGNADINDGDSIAEGIGRERVTKNIEGVAVEKAYRIDDQTALTIIYHLLREENLFLGLSSGINVAGAVRVAQERGPGQTIVTIRCDSGHKYLSTVYNFDWLAAKKLDSTLQLEAIMSLPEA
jgi:cysteine synthase